MRGLFGLLLAVTGLPLMAAELSVANPDRTYFSGADIEITVQADAGTLEDGTWLGIFESDGRYHDYTYWESGRTQYTLKAPEQAGDYDIRLTTDYDGSTFEAKLPINVAVLNKEQVSLELATSKVEPRHEIRLTVKSDAPLSPKGWIGLFKANVPHDSHAGYLTYQYLDNKNSFVFQAPEDTGSYDIRLFDDAYGREIGSVELQVRQPEP